MHTQSKEPSLLIYFTPQFYQLNLTPYLKDFYIVRHCMIVNIWMFLIHCFHLWLFQIQNYYVFSVTLYIY